MSEKYENRGIFLAIKATKAKERHSR